MYSIEGNIVNKEKTFLGRVEIGDDGIISAVSEPTGNADLILKDELIFPGFIDLHVHARECLDHSQDYKEDFKSAGQAAVNGGVVAFADMPNNPVPPVDDRSYNEKKQLTKKSAVGILLYAGVGPNTNPLNQKVPYKVYMGKSIGDLFFNSFEELESAIVKYSGQTVSFHCEDPKVLSENQKQPTHGGRRPAQAELNAVDFAIKLIEKYGLDGKICHVSTLEALAKIVEAKNKGIKITCEVAPHHLYFDLSSIYQINSESSAEALAKADDDIRSKMFQVNPPIRQTQENRLALISALKNGDIDFLATDHAPHSLEEKAKGASGLTHLDTYGPFVSWLMKEHQFSPNDIARVCSYNPGMFFNEFSNERYGKIAQGFVGSLSIIDMDRPITIDKSFLKTKAGWSPFEGVIFPGQVKCTVIKGKIYQI